jgi:hypothetical protein
MRALPFPTRALVHSTLLGTAVAILGATLVTACGATPRPSASPAPIVASVRETPPPQNLDEALTRAGLERFEPAVVSRTMGHLETTGPVSEGRRVTLNVTAEWNQSSPVFARRSDGSVVLLSLRPTTIVDRHLPGGCRHFVGGRAWFETIVYELPEGTRYAGSEAISWEEHVEVLDHTDTEADGSPCPPPAID